MEKEYEIIFIILEYCYKICKDDDLGGLLGVMSHNMFSDNKPVDCAIYNDWISICHLYDAGESKNIINFLEIYEKKYDFNFSKTKNVLFNINDDDLSSLILYVNGNNKIK